MKRPANVSCRSRERCSLLCGLPESPQGIRTYSFEPDEAERIQKGKAVGLANDISLCCGAFGFGYGDGHIFTPYLQCVYCLPDNAVRKIQAYEICIRKRVQYTESRPLFSATVLKCLSQEFDVRQARPFSIRIRSFLCEFGHAKKAYVSIRLLH